ncbi:hypothetical protein ACHHYP_12719 [Achlya hypogyna]|uniref:Uncharacterized protein n=1 Tax=Achlya hypogyna TaxID=1202772 RepID=A0A1V9ZGY2_ACHHY|nr:hypothetical protein ACHHYP_12719 [Achlya hypogyna]
MEKHATMALELLAKYPEASMVQLPDTKKKYVYAIDYAVHAGSSELLRQLLVRNFGKATTNAMDDAAEAGDLAMVELLHEYRSEGCTFGAFQSAKKNKDHEMLAYLTAHRARDQRRTPPAKFKFEGEDVMLLCTIQ